MVDDNPTNRLILDEILAAWRMDAVCVDHGSLVKGAIEAAHRASNPFSLVLLDVHMPDIDGFAVAEIISRMPEASELPVIMLSSSDAVHHKRALNTARISAYLTKPVKQSELLESILALNAPNPEKSVAPLRQQQTPESQAPGARGILLVVEDNYVNQQLMHRVLVKDGYEVILVGDGSDAVKYLAKYPVDAVLMDCQMPTMDGYEATRQIRQADRVSRCGDRLPIIALTANALSGDREKCLASGMDDFVTKPILFTDLYDTLAQHIRLPPSRTDAAALMKETIETAGDGSPGSATQELSTWQCSETPKQDIPTPRQVDHEVINREELLNRVGGDEELIGILAEAFREDAPRHIAAYTSALTANDLQTAKKIAHTIKGCAGNLSGIRLSKFALSLEKYTSLADLDAAKQSLPKLELEINALLDQIEHLAESMAR